MHCMPWQLSLQQAQEEESLGSYGSTGRWVGYIAAITWTFGKRPGFWDLFFFSELSLESWAEVKSRYPRQVTTLVKRNIICQALGHSRVLRKVPLRTGEWTLDNQIYTTFGAMWHTSSQGTESNLTSAWVKTGLNKDKWRTSRGRWRIKRKILYLNRKSRAVIVLDSGVRGFK